MILTQLLRKATLVRRYKRFLADVILPTGETITVHCPNTGSMKNCIVEGSDCWLLHSDNPKRKYAYTWQLATTPTGHLACINTQVANKVVAQALVQGVVSELSAYPSEGIRTEVKYGDKSRIDFMLEASGLPQCYVEVKSVTLLDTLQPENPDAEYCGFFPDAVSTRGQKHLQELMNIVAEGRRAVLLFCVLHTGIQKVRAAQHIDPKYAALLQEAKKAGVEILAYGAHISSTHITLTTALPVEC